MEKYAPMVVTTVVEKNNACPKLQFGSLVAFRNADTPLLLAFSTSAMNFSISSSERPRKPSYYLRIENTSICDMTQSFERQNRAHMTVIAPQRILPVILG